MRLDDLPQELAQLFPMCDADALGHLQQLVTQAAQQCCSVNQLLLHAPLQAQVTHHLHQLPRDEGRARFNRLLEVIVQIWRSQGRIITDQLPGSTLH